MGFFSRIRCQPDAVKDSLRILSPFIRPHHMRMPKRFGRELFGNPGAFFQICKQELDKAIGIGEQHVFDPVLGKTADTPPQIAAAGQRFDLFWFVSRCV